MFRTGAVSISVVLMIVYGECGGDMVTVMVTRVNDGQQVFWGLCFYSVCVRDVKSTGMLYYIFASL